MLFHGPPGDASPDVSKPCTGGSPRETYYMVKPTTTTGTTTTITSHCSWSTLCETKWPGAQKGDLLAKLHGFPTDRSQGIPLCEQECDKIENCRMIVWYSNNGGCNLFQGNETYNTSLCSGDGATTRVNNLDFVESND